MANKKRKRSRPSTTLDSTSGTSNLAWKKVDVGLLAPTQAAAGSGQADDDDFDNAVNHYDAPESKTYRKAERDLEAGPKEGVGFFFGLEVLDGSQYSVVEKDGNKRIVMKSEAGSAPGDAHAEKREEKSIQKNATASEMNVKAAPKKIEEKAAEEKKTKKAEKKKVRRKASFDSIEDTAEESISSNRSFDSDDDDDDGDDEPDPVKEAEREAQRILKKKLKKKKKLAKKKEKKKLAKLNTGDTASAEEGEADETKLYSLQTSWMTATGGVTIRPELCKSLLAQNFWSPTPIQAASLPAATLGRRNIVGAAPTGSGKTLAYLLPIFDHLLRQQETNQNVDCKIQALILAPTRELALQVQKECNKLIPGKCGALVGGMSTQKQERILRQNKHPIIVATPGRLWEMISSREHEHLNDLSQIAFLVIDECDRMTEQGSFPQLHSILDTVEKANPMDDDEDDNEDGSDNDDGADADRLMSLPGIKGEAKVVMLNDDILKMIEQQRTGKAPVPVEEEDSVNEEEEADDMDLLEMDDAMELPVRPPVNRQTFVYSATLTLPPSASYIPSRNKRKKRLTLKGLEGAIEEILDKARARGQTKVIDLSNSKKQAKFNEKILETQVWAKGSKDREAPVARTKFNLPPGLNLQELKCTQLHKDGFLYAYLLTTREGASGPSLVFCNSIVAVKRVGETLKLLGLPVRVLHANMQQRARFKSVESLQKESRAVVVATDVAARGLDIPDVATVVHYDVSRKVDGFVHRAGRTARGMGEKAVGSSMSLISPAEERAHAKILSELNVGFEAVQLDSRLLTAAQERVNLASKIIKAEDVEGKAQRSNQWFIDSAKEAGLEIDDEVFDDGLAGGNQKEQQQLREAKRAKVLLRRLLAEPMVTQRYGKFLSSNTAAQKAEVAPFIVQSKIKQANRKKQKKNR